MTERITITIKKDLLANIDSTIDKKSIKNRSHAVEKLLLESMAKNQLNTVLVVAGGNDAKLGPITHEIPKPLIPIQKKPVLEHQLLMLKRSGIKHVIVSLGHRHEDVIKHFGNRWNDIDISYIVEQKPMGTAWCLARAKDYIDSSFGMLNVDTLVNPDIQGMYTFHKSHGSLCTLLLRTSPDTKGFGAVVMHGNRVVDFIEKPKNVATNLISIGFYIMEPEVMDLIPKKKFMIEQFFSMLAKRNQIAGFMHDKMSYDISTPECYERAIKFWKTIL